MMDNDIASTNGGPGMERIAAMMADSGAVRLYLKYLSPNDNSKNQPYFGGSFDVLNILPLASNFVVEQPESRKPAVDKGNQRMKANVNFRWLDSDGNRYSAPHARLILYPQYPEVRLSGFIQGAERAPRELMDEKRRGRERGRVLYLGITNAGTILGYVAGSGSEAAKEARGLELSPNIAVFSELDLSRLAGRGSGRNRLLDELARIHNAGWIDSKALQGDGTIRPCRSRNCGGYTLEAELGILPNGHADPDFLGWEVKQHDVGSLDRPQNHVVTLLTPNPDAGDYAQMPLADFVRRYGYADRRGRPDRMNFGGIHRFGDRQHLTGLSLDLDGFNPDSPGRFEADGALVLRTDSGDIAASWTFAKLLGHWNRKHERAVFVPSERAANRLQRYRYGREIHLGEGTDFLRLLKAIAGSHVYYDPGIKLVQPADARPETKSRSQFRIKSGGLGALYDRWTRVDVTDAAQTNPPE